MGGKSKSGGKGKTAVGLGPTDVVAVYLDVPTAQTLLWALTLALSGGNGKKKKKGKKKGK
ncbi:MAG: hypothetical protein L0229_30040 [Blastocatellia bacterium]|nr:hypothetical protein [Blastocatellia bacterium]